MMMAIFVFGFVSSVAMAVMLGTAEVPIPVYTSVMGWALCAGLWVNIIITRWVDNKYHKMTVDAVNKCQAIVKDHECKCNKE